MQDQTILELRRRPSSTTYDRLVLERTEVALRLVDALGHRATQIAHETFTRASRLDDRLSRYRRYGFDRVYVVEAAEQDRWHDPRTTCPATPPVCLLCVKDRAEIPHAMVLPFLPVRRVA